jgi:S-adenosyl-L-methionine hydrolase (adenosine-forming)
MNRSGIITLTTDFGARDPYVAVMKGVILSINPEARIIDISNQVDAGAIAQAASILVEVYSFFPKGTIHVGVIDPGVGGDRRPIIIKTEDHFFIGPDNGLFWPIINTQKDVAIIHLTEKKFFLSQISHTFHGRDIFAPVAAHICRGVDPFDMGTIITDPVRLNLLVPQKHAAVIRGQIIRVDHFGNLLTNIHSKDIAHFSDSPLIRVGDANINGLKKTYAEAMAGELIAIIGSSDYLELAVNRGRASNRIGVDEARLIGTEVEVKK